MKARYTFSGLVALFAVAALVTASHAADLTGVKCPISGKPAVEAQSVDFDGGKVYFCCEKCPPAFTKNPAKFAAKAAHQLAQTGQATQEKCPFSGKPIDKSKTVTVDGVEVSFCCEKCQAKVQAANGEQQLNMCFGPGAFKKAYTVK